uniref:Uncharacterized protein n=1 Tax=Photinus pyralis TaxID=7054 RepID=A0A1Y1LEL7_PHOPY
MCHNSDRAPLVNALNPYRFLLPADHERFIAFSQVVQPTCRLCYMGKCSARKTAWQVALLLKSADKYMRVVSSKLGAVHDSSACCRFVRPSCFFESAAARR